MCSWISACLKRNKDDNDNIDINANSNKQFVQNTIKLDVLKRGDTSTNYNLYIVQKNIQQLLDLQKMQMEYLHEIERIHKDNSKDE